jgi:hypothetical protein
MLTVTTGLAHRRVSSVYRSKFRVSAASTAQWCSRRYSPFAAFSSAIVIRRRGTARSASLPVRGFKNWFQL